MPQAQTMTLDEKLAICCKAAELKKAANSQSGYITCTNTYAMKNTNLY